MTHTPQQIIDFWLYEVKPERWYVQDDTLDAQIARRLAKDHEAARDGKLSDWQNTPEGALALLLLLDQVPRNIFRGEAEAFATDAKARAVATRAIEDGFDLRFETTLRVFFYLPFEHSENLADQNRSVELVAGRIGTDGVNYGYAVKHRDVIEKYGRFPGRNAALNRPSTTEEEAFLAQPQDF